MQNDRNVQQIRSMHTEFRAAEDGQDKYIEGYFATFGSIYTMWPGATESVDPGAFDGDLMGDIRFLIDHETRLVLGRTKAKTAELKVDTHGLYGRVKINPSDQDAMNLYARVERGDVDQCSFGFDILDEETKFNDDGSVHWLIKKVKLYEVSVVTFPAYEDTAVAARKKDFEQIQKRQMEVWRAKQKGRLGNA
jgi:HK97 family phage prohead protease